jgi:hypothetical protein
MSNVSLERASLFFSVGVVLWVMWWDWRGEIEGGWMFVVRLARPIVALILQVILVAIVLISWFEKSKVRIKFLTAEQKSRQNFAERLTWVRFVVDLVIIRQQNWIHGKKFTTNFKLFLDLLSNDVSSATSYLFLSNQHHLFPPITHHLRTIHHSPYLIQEKAVLWTVENGNHKKCGKKYIWKMNAVAKDYISNYTTSVRERNGKMCTQSFSSFPEPSFFLFPPGENRNIAIKKWLK